MERVIRERGRVDVDRLRRLTGEQRDPDVGRWAVAPETLVAAQDRLRALVDEAGALGLDIAPLDAFDRAVLDDLGEFTVEGGRARAAGAADPLAGSGIVARLAAEPFAPPDVDDVDPAEIRELIRRGELVQLDGVVFAASAIDAAADVVARLLAASPDGITVAEARDGWGTTRKFAIPLISRLDETGVTRRRGDLRIAGPRLPDGSPS